MFNEITGSRAILSKFNGKSSWISTIDRILPLNNTTQDSIMRDNTPNNAHNVTLLSDNDDYLNYVYEVVDKNRLYNDSKNVSRSFRIIVLRYRGKSSLIMLLVQSA